jgi:tRNAThr (cytosine32-N3)-methyltransferase
LHHEFPGLVDAMREDKGDAVIVELGCGEIRNIFSWNPFVLTLSGTGSSIYPLLSKNANPKLQIKAYDYSAQAIKFVQANPMYSSTQMANDPAPSEPVVGSISASTWDITSPHLPPDLPEGSADIIILVFVLSALRPEEWAIAVNNIYKVKFVAVLRIGKLHLRTSRSLNPQDSSSSVIMEGMISHSSDLKQVDC